MQKSIEENKKAIVKNIKWNSKKPKEHLGGQHCGTINYPVILKSEELDLEIIIGYSRSQLKNKQIAYELFELAIKLIHNPNQ